MTSNTLINTTTNNDTTQYLSHLSTLNKLHTGRKKTVRTTADSITSHDKLAENMHYGKTFYFHH